MVVTTLEVKSNVLFFVLHISVAYAQPHADMGTLLLLHLS